MASSISTKTLADTAMKFIVTDQNDNVIRALVEEGIKQADRDLRGCDIDGPLHWFIHPFDVLPSTVYPADISAVTSADPAVFTADSQDDNATGHGFHDNSSAAVQDIVVIDDIQDEGDVGTGSIEELNGRTYLLEYVSATTFTLKTIDGLDAVSTSGLSTYDEGGVVYHAGYKLNTTTILASVSSAWGFGRVLYDPPPTFDGYPAHPIGDIEVVSNQAWSNISSSGRPSRIRYWRNMATTSSTSHYLFWYPPASSYHNVSFHYERDVSDISTFSPTTYPFHPPELHDALWHGALAWLVGIAERPRRASDKMIATQIEVMFAQKWVGEFEKDKRRARKMSRILRGSMGGRRAMRG